MNEFFHVVRLVTCTIYSRRRDWSMTSLAALRPSGMPVPSGFGAAQAAVATAVASPGPVTKSKRTAASGGIAGSSSFTGSFHLDAVPSATPINRNRSVRPVKRTLPFWCVVRGIFIQ